MDEKLTHEVARKIMTGSTELYDLAVRVELDVLAHLLSMVVLEASKIPHQPDGAA